MPSEPRSEASPSPAAEDLAGIAPRKPWQAPRLILAEPTRDASRISNGFPTDNHTGATLITGDS
jgi:hypothetical protein